MTRITRHDEAGPVGDPTYLPCTKGPGHGGDWHEHKRRGKIVGRWRSGIDFDVRPEGVHFP